MLKVLTKAMQGELTKRQYDCMYAYYFENKTQAQIAKELGIGAPTVNIHMKKAKERFFKVLRYSFQRLECEKVDCILCNKKRLYYMNTSVFCFIGKYLRGVCNLP